jgi:N-formylglutamate amidohydrolase
MEAFERHSIKALFDCHSLNGIGPAEAPDVGEKRKDIILSNNGDKNGNSDGNRGRITCPSEYMHVMKKVFEKKGFSVSINNPYAGGFIMKNYGNKFASNGKISVQIEINQDLCLAPSSKYLSTNRVNNVKNRVLQAFLEIAGKLDFTPDGNIRKPA